MTRRRLCADCEVEQLCGVSYKCSFFLLLVIYIYRDFYVNLHTLIPLSDNDKCAVRTQSE